MVRPQDVGQPQAVRGEASQPSKFGRLRHRSAPSRIGHTASRLPRRSARRSMPRTRHQQRGTVDPAKPFFVEVECYDQISLGKGWCAATRSAFAAMARLPFLLRAVGRRRLQLKISLDQISLGTLAGGDEFRVSVFRICDLPSHRVAPFKKKTPRTARVRAGQAAPTQ